ncbi:MAG: protein kinase domain-containing protein [Myxococcaceae bacterium]
MLDRIKIRGPLRCAGVGRLQCAEELETGARLAVRWVPNQANANGYAQTLRAVPEHPALPKVLHIGNDPESLYAVLEFPEGRLLAADDGTLIEAEELARMGQTLAEALRALHSKGIHHGELSPHSVLRVSQTHRSLIWDLPLVLAARITDRRNVRGTQTSLEEVAPCLAPEVARGDRSSPAADIYGLAALLCLAGGSPPPFGESALSILHQVATGFWRPRIPPHATGGLRRALELMLDPAPNRRPGAEKCVKLLERWHEDVPFTAVVAARAKQQPRGRVIAAAAIALFVVVGGSILALRGDREPEAPVPEAWRAHPAPQPQQLEPNAELENKQPKQAKPPESNEAKSEPGKAQDNPSTAPVQLDETHADQEPVLVDRLPDLRAPVKAAPPVSKPNANATTPSDLKRPSL